MHFLKRPLALFLSLVPLALVKGGDICAYTGRSCSSTFMCCNGIGESNCCQWGQPSGYGWSVMWRNMTVDWRGTTYSDATCAVQSGAIFVGRPASDACKQQKSVYIGTLTSNRLNAWFRCE
ncbi:hypothetical protein BKA70DRAFT_1264851 [Coprinopsis sp. MPI-PUGE-AT-0042]|nr:hypothetical protein BKA70DRAFT_1264851 [Coprinopsis sp. MPI-PUGE-AT-0042]